MSNFFNVEWDGIEASDAHAEMDQPRRTASEGQEKGTAWEIQFSDSPSQGKPKRAPPKFSKSSPGHERTAPSNPSIKPSSMRSSSSPLKANGTRSFVKPAALKALSKPTTKSPTKSSSSARDVSPKKQLPAIRKPLLPVTSPTKKSILLPELRSQSDSILSPRALGKAAEDGLSQSKKNQRPHSASPSLNSVGRKQAQRSQLMQHQRLGQENKQCVGMEARSPEHQKQLQGNRHSTGQVRNKVVKDTAKPATKPATDKTELLTNAASLPVVNVSTSVSPDVGSRPAVTPADMAQRKVLDLKRWYCMSHPQYSKSCGISSVVSCWNFLFSTLGNGTLPPISQELALSLLGFEPPFSKIEFGPFTGNMTCMRWFQTLCDHYGTNGQSYYFFKPVGPRKTAGMRPGVALEKLQEGLNSPDTAFIYHCYNHYFCPIGYENVPKLATDAYRVNLRPSDVDTWILIGEPSRTQSGIQCKRWDHIVKDLTCELPQYFNIRHTERGILTKTTRRTGTNLHCIMAFKRLQDSFNVPISNPTYAGNDLPSLSEVEDLNSSDSDLPSSPEHRSKEGGPWKDQLPNVDDVDLGILSRSPAQTCPPDSSLTKEEISDPAIEGDTDKKDDQESNLPPIGGLRRSGTFTKEKPTLKVEQRRPLSSDSESSVDGLNADHSSASGPENISQEEHESEVESPALSEASQGEVDGSPVAVLKRSNTFTKEKPSVLPDNFDLSYEENVDLDETLKSPALSEASQGEVDGSPVAVLKRSNTFTKEKPSVPPDSFDLSHTEDVDLDETLKSSDYF